jgi:hypothetical protein
MPNVNLILYINRLQSPGVVYMSHLADKCHVETDLYLLILTIITRVKKTVVKAEFL